MKDVDQPILIVQGALDTVKVGGTSLPIALGLVGLLRHLTKWAATALAPAEA